MAGFLCPDVHSQYYVMKSVTSLLQIPFEQHRPDDIVQDILYYQQVMSLHILWFLQIIHAAKKKKNQT